MANLCCGMTRFLCRSNSNTQSGACRKSEEQAVEGNTVLSLTLWQGGNRPVTNRVESCSQNLQRPFFTKRAREVF